MCCQGAPVHVDWLAVNAGAAGVSDHLLFLDTGATMVVRVPLDNGAAPAGLPLTYTLNLGTKE